MPRPHEILELDDAYFSGGAHLTEAQAGGLMSILKGAVERAPIVAVTGSRALTAADEGRILEVDPAGGSITITLPTGLDVGFFTQVRQVGTGTVTIAGAGGTTVNAAASLDTPLTLAEQWGPGATVEVRATNSWLVTGQLVLA